MFFGLAGIGVIQRANKSEFLLKTSANFYQAIIKMNHVFCSGVSLNG